MRGLAARPFVCVVVALCVAGLALVVLMPGAQADAKPCSKPTNGQKVGWQRGHGPKHPAAKQLPCMPSGSPAAQAELSGGGDGVGSLPDQAEVAGPTLIPVPLERAALTGSVERPSGPPATTSAGPVPIPSSTPTTEIQVTAHSPAAIDDSVLLVGVVIGFILAVSAVVVGAGRRGGRRAN
jgi:hypothetical protein